MNSRGGFPPVLFDLTVDPDELIDLGRSDRPEHVTARAMMHAKLGDWSLRYRQRATWSEARNVQMTGMEEQLGVLIGYWDEASALGKDPKILPQRFRKSDA